MTKIILIQGDITEQDTEVIVNAANRTLMGGGGVDGAIHRAGGPDIIEACEKIIQTTHPDGLPTGEAVITTGGKLPAKYVIHTVGPIFNRYKDDIWKDDLTACYKNSLQLAIDNGIKTISFPSISTGIYRCPIEICSKIAVETVREFIQNHKELDEVRFVLFSEKDYLFYQQALNDHNSTRS